MQNDNKTYYRKSTRVVIEYPPKPYDYEKAVTRISRAQNERIGNETINNLQGS
jgi:hypothetical protein